MSDYANTAPLAADVALERLFAACEAMGKPVEACPTTRWVNTRTGVDVCCKRCGRVVTVRYSNVVNLGKGPCRACSRGAAARPPGTIDATQELPGPWAIVSFRRMQDGRPEGPNQRMALRHDATVADYLDAWKTAVDLPVAEPGFEDLVKLRFRYVGGEPASYDAIAGAEAPFSEAVASGQRFFFGLSLRDEGWYLFGDSWSEYRCLRLQREVDDLVLDSQTVVVNDRAVLVESHLAGLPSPT